MHLLTLFTFAAVLATRAWGWGDEGHKITATIAQIHLLPSAHRAICSILPSRYGCNLANIATWPDDVKKQREWLWSAGLHFVNGVDDYPPEDCAFGTKGWTTDQNILNAIVNMTRNVGSLTGDDQDVALRFLTHFLGDIHQPLHMTGRDVGGNYVPVLFNGKNTSLHYAWDDLLILERISLLNNYTNPLPTSPDPTVPPPVLARNRHIESALNGSNYDPLIRWIVLEGIYGWWATELEEWTTCPQFAMENQVSQQVMGLTEEPPYKDPIDVPICPYHWAKPSHQMLCDFIWRPDLQGVKHPRDAVYKIELNTPEYAGRVRNEKMVEKQLALGGMRLAAVLNEVLGSEEDIQEFGFFNPNHRHDDPWEQEHDRIREEIRQSHRFQSFADIRENNTVKWHIDGHDYFWALSEILDSAKECIFILDWWLSPEMYLRRPPADNQEWRLDRLLHRKAQQGVKIYVIVYKEVTQTMTLSSRHTKNALNELHENVMCLRHPDHIGSDSAVQFWSHHEKVVIVDNKRACIGGLDACFGRWDTHNHPLADCHPTDFSRTLFPGQDYNNARVLDFQKVDHYVNTQISSLEIGRMPWHDVHMTLTGPVVLDIVQHFIERWNEIKLRKYKKRTQVDWLALPHDVEAEPEHPISRHPHLERWRDIGRKFKQYWQGEGTPPDDVDGHSPFGTCRVQVVRSVGDWSHGVLTEDSVQQAYIQLIREARHFIYIENQFFISNTGNVGPVKNQIAKALVERIVEAASHGQKFKVIVVIPEVPGFAGNIKNENGLKTIMAAQYRTINRGGHSIYEEIRRAGYEPRDYIRFYHLRTYDRINSPASFIKEMEQNSGVTYHEAQIAQARLWIGDDGYWHQEKVQIQGPQTDFGIDLSETATTGKDAQKVVEEVDFPPSSEEAREIVKKFESGATREDLGVADSVGQHVLADRTDLKGEKWYGTEQEERDSYVSEVLYVHSKVMIIDDRRVIMGSANINDRSQKGDGDSEIALVVEDLDEIESTMDGQRFMATRFASTLRRKLFREHLGLIPPQNCDRGETEVTSFMRPAPIPNESEIGTREDDAVSDPLSDQFQDLWISTAKKNRAIFSELFRTVPTNVVHNWAEYKTYFPKVKTGRLATELDLDTIKTKLSQIHGHLVEAPLEFLIQQPELVEGADWQGLNPT